MREKDSFMSHDKVALDFVLHIDELVFEAVAPARASLRRQLLQDFLRDFFLQQ